MFDAIPSSVFLVSELEAVATAGVFQRRRAIDGKHGAIDVVFRATPRRSRTKEPWLSSVRAPYGAIRSFSDRSQRTVSTTRHRAESRSRRLQRDSNFDRLPALDRPSVPCYGRWIALV